MTAGLDNRWCILRMSGGSTVGVVEALTEAGYGVWTPTAAVAGREGKSRVRVDRQVSLTPGIAFARDDRLHELVVLSRSPSLTFRRWNADTKRMEQRGCPYFSVFRYQGQYPRVADRHLDPLRQAERRAQPKAALASFHAGDEVRIPHAAFGGLSCVVNDVQGRYASVQIQGAMGEITIMVEMCDLLPTSAGAA